MPRSTVDRVNNPKLAAKSSRNGFDLSHRRLTTSQLGMLLPVLCIHANAGDTYRLSSISQIRLLKPFVTTPFIRLRENLDYFMIPERAFWRGFENFITKQSNYSDSLFVKEWTHQMPNIMPAMQLNSLASTFTGNDELGFSLQNGIQRIASMLGYGLGTLRDNEGNARLSSEQMVNLSAALAYQKIYYSYYRNDKYENCKEEAFNVNDFGAGYDLRPTDTERISKIFRLHYRWLKKDYFMSVSPDTMPRNGFIGYEGFQPYLMQTDRNSLSGGIVSGANYNSNVSAIPNQYASSIQKYGPNLQDPTDNERPGTSGFPVDSSLASQGSTTIAINPSNVQNIRVAFAADRLARRMYAARSSYADQMLAIFGVKPRTSTDDTCVHLGGYSNMLNMFDIQQNSSPAAQSVTDRNQLGRIASNINNVNKSKTIKVHCKDHSIIMGIYSVSIENDYQQATRVDKHNLRLYYDDFPNEAYENLGRQPLCDYETGINYRSGTNDLIGNPQVVGFVPRYAEDKLPIDIIDDGIAGVTDRVEYVSPISDWIYKLSPSPIPDDKHAMFISRMLTNPHLLDNAVGFPSDGTYQTDQFVTNFWFTVKKVANMSYLGETL